MLTVARVQAGVTLIEVLVALAVLAILMGLAAPGFEEWIVNSQVRTAAETTQNALQIARAEAVKRNTQVRFQFTSSLDAECALATDKPNWVVSLDDPTEACDSAPSDDDAPRIIQTSSGNDGNARVAIEADQAAIVFNGLGRVTPLPAGDINIDFSHASAGDCLMDGGNVRCLRIVVSASGQIRTCDPVRDPSDPRGC